MHGPAMTSTATEATPKSHAPKSAATNWEHQDVTGLTRLLGLHEKTPPTPSTATLLAATAHIDAIATGDTRSTITFRNSWREAQRSDPQFACVYRDLADEQPLANSNTDWLKKKEKFFLDGEHILHYFDDLTDEGRIVVPASHRPATLNAMHTARHQGHRGYSETLRALSQRFWWPRMNRDVKDFVLTCTPCRRAKLTARRLGELQPIIVAEPFHTWSMDFVGPFPKSTAGNTYVMTMVDQFTRRPIFEPLTAITAETASEALYRRLITQYGCPQRILTDRGSQFTAHLFRNAAKLFGVKQLFTTAYHPQSNGKTERLNRVLKEGLRTARATAGDWDTLLPALEFAALTAHHSSVGTSPFEMMYGRQAQIPLDVVFGNKRNRPANERAHASDSYVNALAAKLRATHEIANRIQAERASQAKADHDDRYSPVTHVVGRQVYLYKPIAQPGPRKLLSHWQGPYTVIEFVAPNNVVIEDDVTHKRSRVHVLRVREVTERPARLLPPPSELPPLPQNPPIVVEAAPALAPEPLAPQADELAPAPPPSDAQQDAPPLPYAAPQPPGTAPPPAASQPENAQAEHKTNDDKRVSTRSSKRKEPSPTTDSERKAPALPVATTTRVQRQRAEVETDLIAFQDPEMTKAEPDSFYLGKVEPLQHPDEHPGTVLTHIWSTQHGAMPLALRSYAPLHYRPLRNGRWTERCSKSPPASFTPWLMTIPHENIFAKSVNLTRDGKLLPDFLANLKGALKPLSALRAIPTWSATKPSASTTSTTHTAK